MLMARCLNATGIAGCRNNGTLMATRGMTDRRGGSRPSGEEHSWSAGARGAWGRLAILHSALRIGLGRWRELSEPHQVPRRARHGLHFASVDTHEDGRLSVGDYARLPDLLFHSRTAEVPLF
jgi:hypothetical protein